MKSILLARIANNVLEDKDFPVLRLIVSDIGVEDVTEVQQGCYGTEGMPAPGWSLDQLTKWATYETAEYKYPAEWHDLKGENDPWGTAFIYSRDGLNRLLGRTAR